MRTSCILTEDYFILVKALVEDLEIDFSKFLKHSCI